MALLFGVRSNLLSHPVEIEADTIMLFRQEVAPAGWTRDVASTLNNSALRVMTSGTWVDGKSGATAFDAVFGSGKSSADVTLSATQSGTAVHGHSDNLSVSSAGAHTHDVQLFTTGSGDKGFSGSQQNLGTASNAAISNGAHTHPLAGAVSSASAAAAADAHAHTLSLDLNFCDLILCSKDN